MKVMGLEGVPEPETVKAVVPSVSSMVVVPLDKVAVFSLPFLSLADQEPEAGGLPEKYTRGRILPPEGRSILTPPNMSITSVSPDPSVAREDPLFWAGMLQYVLPDVVVKETG